MNVFIAFQLSFSKKQREVNQKFNKAWYCQIPRLHLLGNLVAMYFWNHCFSFLSYECARPNPLPQSLITHMNWKFDISITISYVICFSYIEISYIKSLLHISNFNFIYQIFHLIYEIATSYIKGSINMMSGIWRIWWPRSLPRRRRRIKMQSWCHGSSLYFTICGGVCINLRWRPKYAPEKWLHIYHLTHCQQASMAWAWVV